MRAWRKTRIPCCRCDLEKVNDHGLSHQPARTHQYTLPGTGGWPRGNNPGNFANDRKKASEAGHKGASTVRAICPGPRQGG
ncbi:KGG domain-containing protein [Komagataeibacter rhaeticus]|nr:KGG domain-containing protein [Komagataeibacter rhaeticus]